MTLGSSVLACLLLLVTACGSPQQVAASRAAAGMATATAGTATAGTALATARPSAPAAHPAASDDPDSGSPRVRMLAVGDTLGACERRLKSASPGVPTLAIVGASYTAGVGPGVASLSWAAVLARTLRWNAVIYGVPGAGYVARGSSTLGPVTRMLGAERLRRLDPSLVIVQAGHDDGGVPAAIERRQVRRAIEEIRTQAPHARIALLTVFTKPNSAHLRAYYRTDSAIVAAARAADPAVIIMDPLAGRWQFAHFDGVSLHPTAAGDAQIARRVAATLASRGIVAVPGRTAAAPASCQVSIGVGGDTDEARSTARDD